MSADNYRICPRCRKRHYEKVAADAKKAAEAYGKVPMAEWQAMCKEADNPPPLEDTLREDYECYIDPQGTMRIYYGATCEKCRFTADFNHIEELNIGE